MLSPHTGTYSICCKQILLEIKEAHLPHSHIIRHFGFNLGFLDIIWIQSWKGVIVDIDIQLAMEIGWIILLFSRHVIVFITRILTLVVNSYNRRERPPPLPPAEASSGSSFT